MNKKKTLATSATNETRKAMKKQKPDVLFPVAETLHHLPAEYGVLVADIKQLITRERIKTVVSANAAMVLMYWDIGHLILERQHRQGWGARVVDRLAHDLKQSFPELTGFSPRNLKYMRQFCEAWPDRSIVQRTVAQLPWRSNLILLEKLNDAPTRLWYAEQALKLGMGKDMLAIQIEGRLHERQGKAQHNFAAAIPPHESDMTKCATSLALLGRGRIARSPKDS